MPATSSTKPSAPASTTLARRSISSFSGVASSETRAAASACAEQRPEVADARARRGRGRVREIRDHREDRALARLGERFARVGGAAGQRIRELRRRRASAACAARSPTPSRNCARIAPELPRAPSSAASATRVRSWPACGSGFARSAASTACSVSARFVPVSPSGTGKHVDLVDHFLARDEAVDAGAQRGGELRAVERECRARRRRSSAGRG